MNWVAFFQVFGYVGLVTLGTGWMVLFISAAAAADESRSARWVLGSQLLLTILTVAVVRGLTQ